MVKNREDRLVVLKRTAHAVIEKRRGVHNLKHTLGRRLEGADVPYHLRQVLLGHKSKDVTEHYSAVKMRRLVIAANSILDNPHDCAKKAHGNRNVKT